MTRWLARLVLSLYPLAFRRRYGEEMRALLDETPARVPTVLDLLRGALAAHLRPAGSAAGFVSPAERVRASTSGVLACWAAFAAAGLGFYKTTEDAPFAAAGHAHPLLGGAHIAVQALAGIGSAAVVIGALPLITAAFAHARRHPSLWLPMSLPVLAVVLFTLLTGLLIWIAQSSHHATAAGRGAFIAWGLAGLACGALCVVGARVTLFALPLPRRRLVVALACGTLVTAAMAAMALAVALYSIALWRDAMPLASAPNGPFGVISTDASLVMQLVVMVVAGTLAATTTRRGWRAVSQLDASAAL